MVKNLAYSFCALLCMLRIGAYQQLARAHSPDMRLLRGLCKLKASMLACSACFLQRMLFLLLKQMELHDYLIGREEPVELFSVQVRFSS